MARVPRSSSGRFAGHELARCVRGRVRAPMRDGRVPRRARTLPRRGRPRIRRLRVIGGVVERQTAATTVLALTPKPSGSSNVWRLSHRFTSYVTLPSIRIFCKKNASYASAPFFRGGRGGGPRLPRTPGQRSNDVRGSAATRPRARPMLHVRDGHPAQPGGHVRGLHSLAGASTRRRNLETRLAAENTRRSDAPDARDWR